jgi:hypothetical protein
LEEEKIIVTARVSPRHHSCARRERFKKRPGVSSMPRTDLNSTSKISTATWSYAPSNLGQREDLTPKTGDFDRGTVKMKLFANGKPNAQNLKAWLRHYYVSNVAYKVISGLGRMGREELISHNNPEAIGYDVVGAMFDTIGEVITFEEDVMGYRMSWPTLERLLELQFQLLEGMDKEWTTTAEEAKEAKEKAKDVKEAKEQ